MGWRKCFIGFACGPSRRPPRRSASLCCSAGSLIVLRSASEAGLGVGWSDLSLEPLFHQVTLPKKDDLAHGPDTGPGRVRRGRTEIAGVGLAPPDSRGLS